MFKRFARKNTKSGTIDSRAVPMKAPKASSKTAQSGQASESDALDQSQTMPAGVSTNNTGTIVVDSGDNDIGHGAPVNNEMQDQSAEKVGPAVSMKNRPDLAASAGMPSQASDAIVADDAINIDQNQTTSGSSQNAAASSAISRDTKAKNSNPAIKHRAIIKRAIGGLLIICTVAVVTSIALAALNAADSSLLSPGARALIKPLGFASAAAIVVLLISMALYVALYDRKATAAQLDDASKQEKRIKEEVAQLHDEIAQRRTGTTHTVAALEEVILSVEQVIVIQRLLRKAMLPSALEEIIGADNATPLEAHPRLQEANQLDIAGLSPKQKQEIIVRRLLDKVMGLPVLGAASTESAVAADANIQVTV